MKILIFSDSHGRDTNIKKVLEQHNNFNCCIHLGDGTREFLYLSENYPDIPFVYVHGNYEDFYGDGPGAQTILDIEGHRLLLTHGHRYGVKGGTQSLVYHAMEENCDIILYGHTHVRENRFFHPDENTDMYIFNPGSISRPLFGDYTSYGILELSKSGVLFSHNKI